MSFDDLYRQNILEHYQNPRNFGTLEHPDISAEDSNPLCGDEIRIDLKVRGGKIEDAAGSLIGDQKLQGEGMADKVAGSAQKPVTHSEAMLHAAPITSTSPRRSPESCK